MSGFMKFLIEDQEYCCIWTSRKGLNVRFNLLTLKEFLSLKDQDCKSVFCNIP